MPYKLDPNTGKYTYIPESNSGNNGGGGTNTDKSKVVQGDPAATAEQIAGTTDNLTEENANDVFGRGKAKGDFRLRKYTKVNISGIGKSFEGTYFLSEVTHTISTNGYEVDFSIKTKQENIGTSSSSSSSSSSDDVTKAPSETAGRQPEAPSSSGSSQSGGMRLDPVTGTWTKV